MGRSDTAGVIQWEEIRHTKCDTVRGGNIRDTWRNMICDFNQGWGWDSNDVFCRYDKKPVLEKVLKSPNADFF